jgi:hypothetical protein
MIKLILDTNQWIYLANAIDPHTQNVQDNHHFILYKKIVELMDDGAITLYKSHIIEAEWERNIAATAAYIKKIKAKCKDYVDRLQALSKELDEPFADSIKALIAETQRHYDEQIKMNKDHIATVAYLLKAAKSYSIPASVRAEVTDWAIARKAPFIGDKSNSHADATILFGAIHHIEKLGKTSKGKYPESAFISGNVNDFAASGKPQQIHGDLAEKLNEVGMQFFNSLPAALRYVNESLLKVEEWERIEWLFNKRFGEMPCMSCELNESIALDAHVGFGAPFVIEVYHDEDEEDDENTTTSRDNEERHVVQIGYCGSCHTGHIKCACGDVLCAEDIDSDDTLQCGNCEKSYKIEFDLYPSETHIENVYVILPAGNGSADAE